MPTLFAYCGRFPLLLVALALLSGCAATNGLCEAERAGIAGKTYVITGPSSGLGRGVALRLASLHANVVLAARRTEVLAQVANEANAAGGKALVVTTDVSKPEEMERLAEQAVARFGRIDVWINNAGVGAIGRFETIPIADHTRLIDVNLKGVIYGSHVALRQFQRQHAGTLVNIGSVESEEPLAYHASYSASKAAVLSLGRALNEELRLNRAGPITVATVMPWATDTPFFEHAANYSGGTPRMPAMDDPERVVNAIVWVSLHPQEEMAVGWKAKLVYAGHRIAPENTARETSGASPQLRGGSAGGATGTGGGGSNVDGAGSNRPGAGGAGTMGPDTKGRGAGGSGPSGSGPNGSGGSGSGESGAGGSGGGESGGGESGSGASGPGTSGVGTNGSGANGSGHDGAAKTGSDKAPAR
ncbi:MAG: SDR family NAD(P)-dependent oxidoreductase [Massilia sp.]